MSQVWKEDLESQGDRVMNQENFGRDKPRRYCHRTETCEVGQKLMTPGRHQGEYVFYCLLDQACPWRGHFPVRRRIRQDTRTRVEKWATRVGFKRKGVT